MKKYCIYALCFLFTTPLIAMSHKKGFVEVPLGTSCLMPKKVETIEFPVSPIQHDYDVFLSYISKRVDEIEHAVQAVQVQKKTEERGWGDTLCSMWSGTKYYVRAVEKMLRDPESEKQARALLEQIKIIHESTRDDRQQLLLDIESQELEQTVRGKINRLYVQLSHDESSFVRTQVAYLLEYDERIRRVDEALGKGFEL